MRLGMGMTQKDFEGDPLTARGVGVRARMIEDAGFDGIWTGDGFPSFARADVLTTLAIAGSATEHVELGTSILIVPMHHSDTRRCDIPPSRDAQWCPLCQSFEPVVSHPVTVARSTDAPATGGSGCRKITKIATDDATMSSHGAVSFPNSRPEDSTP